VTTRVIVTGGASLVGRLLAASLVERGHDVRIFDVAPVPDARITSIDGDVRDRDAVTHAFEGCDVVVHAAFAPPSTSIQDLDDVNAGGTRNVVAAATRTGCRRLVVVSSTIVTRTTHAHALAPNAPLSRLDRYRDTRVRAEALATEAGERLSVAIVRPKTFVGPGAVTAFALLFSLVRDGATVPILGTGRNRYQLLDVRDFARALTLLVERECTGVYLLGASEFGTVDEDVSALIARSGTGARMRRIPASLSRALLRGMELGGLVPLSEWHQCSAQGADSVVDTSAAAMCLGWTPEYSNVDALVDAYSWYVSDAAAGGPASRPPRSHRLLRSVGARLP
jgi:nucleoside-diphosphate-sugar epimerase